MSCDASTPVKCSGDREEFKQISSISVAAGIEQVPRCVGRRETMLYAVFMTTVLGYLAIDFYWNIGRQPLKHIPTYLLKPGWLTEWAESTPVSLESVLLKYRNVFAAMSVGFLLISHASIRLLPRWIHYLVTGGYTLALTAAITGPRAMVYMLLLHCGAVIMGYFSVWGVWLLVLCAMFLHNNQTERLLHGFLNIIGNQMYFFYPITGYLYCRSISAGHSLNNMLRQQRLEAPNEAPCLLSFLRLHMPRAVAYGFYMPWHFAGPILTFSEFCREAEKAHRLVWDRKLVLHLLWRAARLLLWLLLLQALHHFLPVGAFLSSIQQLDTVPYNQLAFSMYLNGQNFMLLYVQVYGWPGLVARIDGLELPHWPDCISRVCSYRQMWRVFDRGLAAFMHHHIYIPMGGSRRGLVRQVSAVIASFAFVSVYHGDTYSVRVWAALNALHLLIETAVCALYRAKLKVWLSRILSPKVHQRLIAYIVGINLILTSGFMFVFLFNTANALWMIVEIFKPLCFDRPWWYLLLTLTLSYCSVQISLFYECVTAESKKKTKIG